MESIIDSSKTKVDSSILASPVMLRSSRAIPPTPSGFTPFLCTRRLPGQVYSKLFKKSLKKSISLFLLTYFRKKMKHISPKRDESSCSSANTTQFGALNQQMPDNWTVLHYPPHWDHKHWHWAVARLLSTHGLRNPRFFHSPLSETVAWWVIAITTKR